jgi:hypothetical protein
MIALLLQLISCAFMTGVIWIIQVLHYPAFADIREERFLKFHAKHSRDITFIVAPVMVLELVTAILLAWQFGFSAMTSVNLALVVALWACTFLISVPVHNLLSTGQNLTYVTRLVRTNWLRTVLWSVRLILLFVVCASVLGGSYS